MIPRWLCAAVLALCFSLPRPSSSFPAGTPPSFASPLEDRVVARQDRNNNNLGLSLTCDATGDDLTYAWYRGGTLLANEAGRNLIISAPLEDADATEGGVGYYCAVTSSVFGTIRSREALIRVAVFPTAAWEAAKSTESIDTYTAAVTATDIWSVFIPCDPPSSAVPTPTVLWQRIQGSSDPENITTGSRYILTRNGGLIINEPVSADLAYTYRCVVTNALLHRDSISGQQNMLVENNNLAPTPDDDDMREDVTHIYYHDKSISAEHGTSVNILTAIAPAGTMLVINALNFQVENVTEGTATERNYFITSIMNGGRVRALFARTDGNDLMTTAVLETTVTVFDPANVASTSGPHRVLTGRSVTIECTVEAIPVATITWYKDNVLLSSSGNGNTYTISSAQPSNSGMYQCLASNAHGTSVGSISVQVRAPEMSFSDSLERETAFVEGDNVTLSVTVLSDLPPNFRWFVRGVELLASANNDTYTVGDRTTGSQNPSGLYAYNSSLLIQAINTTYEEQYSVEAVENTDSLRATTSGFVLQERLTTAVSVEFLNQPCLLLGQNVTLRCVQNGVPRSSPVWTTGRETIDPDNQTRFLIEEGNELTLTILNVVSADDGSYECTAQNMLRDGTMSQEVVGELIIPEACDPPQSSQSSSGVPSTSQAHFGETATLSCDVSGIPLPTVSWLHRGAALLTPSNRIQISNEPDSQDNTRLVSILTITSVMESDGGEYTCLAVNAAANSITTFNIDYRGLAVGSWVAIVVAIGLFCSLAFTGLTALLFGCVCWRHRTRRRERAFTTDGAQKYCATVTPTIQQPPNHSQQLDSASSARQQEVVYDEVDVPIVANIAYASIADLKTPRPNSPSLDRVDSIDAINSPTYDYPPMVIED